MDQKTKNLFKIPLINKWYIFLTLIFILMKFLKIIDWSPLWILSPLWLPIVICLLLISAPYILIGIIWCIEELIKYINKLKRKWRK